LILGNHYPMADDWSDGFLRRFIIVGFNNRIPDDEVITGIENKIIAEEYADSTQLERSFRPDLSRRSGALERGRSEATSSWVQAY
jgi:hypothetical protein